MDPRDDAVPVPNVRDFRTPRQRQFERRDDALRKLFAPSEIHERNREARALRDAAGSGVPKLLGVGELGDNSQPWIEMEWVGDVDLRMHIGRVGPLPSRTVGTIARSACRILERVHASGLVHGDVKPANLVLARHDAIADDPHTLSLIDWEHASSTESQRSDLDTGFTGGTHGYAPPEAYLGAAPNTSFDIFALGATLHFALTGFPPPRHRNGAFDPRLLLRLRPSLPQDMLQPLRRMLESEPAQRPSASQLVRELESVQHGDAELEMALLEGRDFDDAGDYRDALAQRVHWRRRMDRILQAIDTTPKGLPARTLVERALRFCRGIWLCSNFVPRIPRARARVARAQERLPEILAMLPGEVQRTRQRLEFVEARHLAVLSLNLCRLVSLLVLPERDSPQLVESTGHALQAALRAVEAGERKQRKILDRIEEAEAKLDLPATRIALSELFESFSGANRSTAKIRDRHQRFVWLLQRLAAGGDGIREGLAVLHEAGQKDFEAKKLLETLDRTISALDAKPKEAHRSLNLAARIFAELDQGWPKLGLRGAIQELTSLRRRSSERAGELVDGMERRLRADPVPLRPLLRDLVEVDRILLLDCLVDTPRSTRTALLDRLDKLRLRVEELSDQHRRLARGAREQLEQGRLTTALYDLERALEASAEDEDIGGEDEIRIELEKVRTLRDEVRTASRRNLELAELYDSLHEEDAALEDRLRTLDQREDVLLFLLENGAKPFRPRYSREIHELHVLRLQELSADAMLRYEDNDAPARRLQIAREMLGRLENITHETRSGQEDESGGRRDLLLSRWRDYAGRAERDVQQAQDAELRARAARRVRIVSIVTAFACTAALIFFVLTNKSRIRPSDIEEAASIRAIAALRDRAEEAPLRDALAEMIKVLQASPSDRSPLQARLRASIAAVKDNDLRSALETRVRTIPKGH